MEGQNIGLLEDLQARIEELETKIEALRISRRVLMNLITALEQEKREESKLLQLENDRLQKANVRYANNLLRRNLRILELEQQLKQIKASYVGKP